MAEKTALTDPGNFRADVVPEGDAYRNGMTVEDAYRYLAGAPRTAIQPNQVELD